MSKLLEIANVLFCKVALVLIVIVWSLFGTGCGNDTGFIERHEVGQTQVTQSRTPVPLKATNENKGKRCEDGKNFDLPEPEEDTADYQRCKKLQKELNQAAWDGDIEGIQKALENGASVNAGYYQQGTPLGLAVTKGRAEIVRLLIENGAEVNVKYKWDETPLHYAVYRNYVEIAETLLQNGADVCAVALDDRTEQKLTALDIAEKEGRSEIIRLLRAAGADSCP